MYRMKKINLFYLCLIISLFGCIYPPDNKVDKIGKEYTFNIINVDGCEYIMYKRGISHKGNCKNKIHKK